MKLPEVLPTPTHPEHGIKVLTERSEYQSRHIRIPESDDIVAAIAVAGQYYSFFRVEKRWGIALQMAERLHDRGDDVVITQIPKGFAIWVLESDATGLRRRCWGDRSEISHAKLATSQQRSTSSPANTLVPSDSQLGDALSATSQDKSRRIRVLTSRQQYRLCHIRIAGQSQRLAAIAMNGLYYSLFKTLNDFNETLKLKNKLYQRGEFVVITKTPTGYGLWVWEPEAQLD